MGIDQSYVQLIHNKPVQAVPRLALLVLVAGLHVAAAVALFLGPALQSLQREAPEPLSVQLFEDAIQSEPPAQPATAKASQPNKPLPKPASTQTAKEITPTPSVPPSPVAATPAPTTAASATPATREIPAASPATASAPSASLAAAPAAAVRSTANIDAAYASSNPKPPYPPMARRLGEEGTVTLRILVTSDGLAAKVEIKKSSGSSLLDKSAEQTIKQWRFIPAKLDGKAVEEWYETRWTFKLEG
jgi:protein TonB